ncbi:TRAP transporter small permease [uncultured Cloacibacillus sp.]|uniref:TRAP transporter small permease n=1 Tax=uncultured Cloacibacillus sp. TaxID=889794 RepID=UPI0026DCBC5C|nr:TRAP transporter small permease [uncultured Cloacibacillus sp.]
MALQKGATMDNKIYRGLFVLNNFLQKTEKLIGAAALAILFFVMITNAILRYFFSSGLDWSDELNGYLLVWIGFLSAAYTMSTNSHLNITAVISYLPNWLQYVLRQFMGIVQIIMFLIYIKPLIKLLKTLPISNVMKVPLEYVYIILPISFVLMTYHIIFNLLTDTLQRIAEHSEKGC